jgi:hypothetical protein
VATGFADSAQPCVMQVLTCMSCAMPLLCSHKDGGAQAPQWAPTRLSTPAYDSYPTPPPPPFSSWTRSRSSHTHMAQRRWGTQQPLTITLDPMEAFQPSIGAPLQKLGGVSDPALGLSDTKDFSPYHPQLPIHAFVGILSGAGR